VSGAGRRRRRRREPLAAAAAVARFRRRAGRGPGGAGPGAETAAAALAWADVVGRAAADHSAPVRRSRAGVLTVACSSASWAHELSARRAELTERLAARCPEAGVSALRFAVADHAIAAAAPDPAPAATAPVVPTAEQRATGAAAAAGVGEPALRDLVARAAAASAARRSAP
jgi:predicted nucleic acid-binding Zn ribbon protein